MQTWNPDNYLKAWNFASKAHNGQRLTGSDVPYITHIGLVTMEVLTAIHHSNHVASPDLAVQCALLHDTIEDTGCSYEDIYSTFGLAVAEGVAALSKNKQLRTKPEQMRDSLQRIKRQPHEVWMVKLADRITNLQPPPAHWDQEKIITYREEAEIILAELGTADPFLAKRLQNKITSYPCYLP